MSFYTITLSMHFLPMNIELKRVSHSQNFYYKLYCR